jgi:hypothetical protein
MSDLLLQQGRPRARLGRLLVIFTGSASDERALETALELAGCGSAALEALLLEGEFRGYSVVPGELEQQRITWHARLAEHAFTLCERALTAGMRLPLELVDGNGQNWLRDWVRRRGFVLIVIADPHRPLLRFAPSPLVAHLRRMTTVPIVVVK